MSQQGTSTAKTHSPSRIPYTPQSWRVDTFRALRHRNYQLYFCGQFISVTGSWAQSAALTWLAYELTKESSWPALVGAMQVLPTFVLGAWGGSLADRWPKRRLIFLTQATLLLLAIVLGCLVLLGHVTPWHLLAIATAAGIVNAIDLPARLAFVIDLVGREDLPNAIALNSMLFNLARMVGPVLSGVLFSLVGHGESGETAAGVCFLLNGLSFVAVLAALAWMEMPPPHPQPLSPASGERGASSTPLAPLERWVRSEGKSGTWEGFRYDTPKIPRDLVGSEGKSGTWEGFRYLGRHPGLILLLLLSGSMSLFGWPILSLLPAVADLRLRGSTNAYAWMLSAIGGGAGVASLLVASFTSRLRRRWFLAAGVGLASSSLLCLATARSLPLAVICCAFLGCGLILFFPTSQAIMQLRSADSVRGRVMGIWSMVLCGAHPLGHVLAGQAADRWLNGPLDSTLAGWLSVQPGERGGLPLVLVLMGLGIAAAAALVLTLAVAGHFASKPKLRR
jgi:MFS family permease